MPECGLDPRCWAEQGIGAAVGDAIEDLATAVSEALSQVVTTLSTFWVEMPTSNLTTSDGISASPTVAFLQGSLWYWTAALAVLAVVIGGARMAWEQRGSPVRDLVRSLLTLTLVSGMGLAVIALLIAASDGLSSWILDRATEGNGFAPAIQAMLLNGSGDIAVFMVIIMGLLGIFASVIQIVLMVVRSGMLVILAGILPTTAAFTNTEMGKQWFQKTVAWTLAFILYKPAAAIVYAVAFRLIDTDLAAGSSLLHMITGMALMVVALIALPALLRFVTPMVGAVANGGGGAGTGALAAAAAVMPSGARSNGTAGRGGGPPDRAPAGKGTDPHPADAAGGKAPSGSSAGGDGSGRSGPASGGRAGTPSGSSSGTPAMAGAGAGRRTGGAMPGGPPGTPAPAAGARAGSAAGPAGAAAGAAVSAAAKGTQAAKAVSEDAAGEGPSGSTNH